MLVFKQTEDDSDEVDDGVGVLHRLEEAHLRSPHAPHFCLVVLEKNPMLLPEETPLDAVSLEQWKFLLYHHFDLVSAWAVIFLSKDGRYARVARNNSRKYHPTVRAAAFSLQDMEVVEVNTDRQTFPRGLPIIIYLMICIRLTPNRHLSSHRDVTHPKSLGAEPPSHVCQAR